MCFRDTYVEPDPTRTPNSASVPAVAIVLLVHYAIDWGSNPIAGDAVVKNRGGLLKNRYNKGAI